jgi:hypothetical protein
MIRLSQHRPRHRAFAIRSSGVALVVMLGLIVLITIVVMAFFSRVATHREIVGIAAGSIRTQQIAQVAVSHLVEDLLAEMADGSRVVTSPEGDEVFFVEGVDSMVPQRAVAPELADGQLADNLVKQTKRGIKPFAAAPPDLSRASAVNTADPNSATDGRFISPARWSAPRLLDPGLELDDAQTPDWVYVTRRGSTTPDFSAAVRDKTAGNLDFIVGRYAFQIYDIGGLLDANAFGAHPDELAPELAGAKGSPLLADLGVIPGLEGAPARSTLFSWRDKASGAPGPGRDADSIAVREAGGWDAPRVAGAGGAMDNDNFFVSRQDLIRVLEDRIGPADAARALPYLTHFAKTLNRPSHQPPADRPKVKFDAAAGGNNAMGSDDAINPGERAQADGRLLVKNRFALAHLGLLADPAANATRIRELFGLVRDGPGWTYEADLLGPSGIRRLGEITGREPNFFEVLKAAIHAGSLGVAHGSSAAQADLAAAGLNYNNLFPGSVASGRDADINLQIMQIGANIIDQYDTDSFPTRIVYDGEAVAGVEALPHLVAIMANYFAEQELAGLKPEGYTTIPKWIGPIESVLLLQPRLWNPYVTINPGPAAGVPRRFRVRAEYVGPEPFVVNGHGEMKKDNVFPDDNVWSNQRADSLTGGSFSARPPTNFRWNYEPLGGRNFGPGQPANPGTAFAAGGGSFEIELPAGWNLNWPEPFSNPYTAFRDNYPRGGITIQNPQGPVQFATIAPGSFDGFNVNLVQVPSMPTTPYTVYGFPLGRTWQGPNVKGPAGNDLLCKVAYAYGGMVVITLSCLGPDGQWIDYDTISANLWNFGGFITNGSQIGGGNHAGSIMRNQTDGWIKFDPRTLRWGTLTASVRAMGVPVAWDNDNDFWRLNEWREGETLMNGATLVTNIKPDIQKQNEPGTSGLWQIDTGMHEKSRGPAPADPSGTAFNSADSYYSYLDPDGVRRRASGAYWSSGNLAGQPMASGTGTDVQNNRPVMLNRPFVSVAELGFAFRDTPWRNLDFFTEESGDAALLDFFCVYPTEDENGEPVAPRNRDGTAIIGGRVNLNTPHAEVIEALLRGVYRNPDDQPLDDASAKSIAEDIVRLKAGDSDRRPFRDLSELVGYPAGGTAYAGLARRLGDLLPDNNARRIERQREAVVRALAGVGQTRTWNFLIDLIVQDGRVVPAAASLADFSIAGEKRYWIAVALDRHSGEILQTQWEPVHE